MGREEVLRRLQIRVHRWLIQICTYWLLKEFSYELYVFVCVCVCARTPTCTHSHVETRGQLCMSDYSMASWGGRYLSPCGFELPNRWNLVVWAQASTYLCLSIMGRINKQPLHMTIKAGSGNQTQAPVLVGQVPYERSSSQLLRYICSPNRSVRAAHFWLHRGADTSGFAMEGLVPQSSEACVLELLKLLTGKTQIPRIIPSLHGHRNEPRQSFQSMKYRVEVNF